MTEKFVKTWQAFSEDSKIGKAIMANIEKHKVIQALKKNEEDEE